MGIFWMHKPMWKKHASPSLLCQCLALGAMMLAGMGCSRSAGVVFSPLDKPLLWPAPPAPARISYVGQLSTSADLKPSVSSLESLDRTLFGEKPIFALLSPFAVCSDGGSRIFVADSGAQTVHVFDLETRKHAFLTLPAPRHFSQPAGIAWDPRGRLFVSDSVGGSIEVFNAKGEYQAQIAPPAFVRPAGLAWDSRNNRLLVADVGKHCIFFLSAEGTILNTLGQRGILLGQFNFPTNVAVDHQGRIYVSDTLNFRIQQFSPELRPTLAIGQKGDKPCCLSQPKGIAVDSEDHLYVLDAQFEAIQIFNAQGQLLLTFGEEGHGPGQFWLPAGIFIDPRNRLWVADVYNRRLQVFDYLPEKQP